MRTLMIPAALAALVSLSGCTLFGENVEDVGKAAGEVVTFYCENVNIPEVREQIRATVNKYAAPNSVAVTCVNAAPAVTTPQ